MKTRMRLAVYMYIYIHTYICVCVCTCVCLCLSVSMSLCVSVCVVFVRGVPKGALRTHSAWQAPLWGSLVTCAEYCLRVDP